MTTLTNKWFVRDIQKPYMTKDYSLSKFLSVIRFCDVKKKALILIAILSFTLIDIISAQRLYIAPSGNDKNNGTKERPLASLAGARDRLRQLRDQGVLDDTVFVQVLPGDYYVKEPLRLGPDDSGTDQSPVIFTADADNRPVFWGGMTLDHFEEVNKNLWRVFVDEVAHYGFYFEQLYINGERRFRAQTPNRGEFYMVRNVVDPFRDTTRQTTEELQKSPLANLASLEIQLFPTDTGTLNSIKPNELDDALVVIHHQWEANRKRIQYFNRDEPSIYITRQGTVVWNKIKSNSRYIIENFRAALDTPGEWFLSPDGYLYYMPLPGETIENTECMVPITENFVVIEGDQVSGHRVENIHFENLCFRVSGHRTPIDGNLPHLLATPIKATIMLDYASHIEFRNCEVAHTGLYAIWFRRACYGGVVQHCHLHDLGAGGIKIGEGQKFNDSLLYTSHITVDNNIIQHGCFVHYDAGAVTIFNASDNNITHNDIADFRYSGISVGLTFGYSFSPAKRNKIEFNHIHHIGWGENSDMGGVYTLGKSEGTTVSNNVIHHIFAFDYGGWGLYTDEGSSDIVLENNLVYRCSNAGYMHHYGKDNIIRNNIFAFNIEAQVQFGVGERHRMYSFLRNIVYFNQGSAVNSTWHSKQGLTNGTADFDSNCYWDARSRQPDFHGLNFKDWQELGRDKNSIIADPLFVDPENFDFRLRRQTVARKIGFKPFDYSKAGVYGNQEWKDMANLPEQLKEAFDKAAVKNAWKGIYGWHESIVK